MLTFIIICVIICVVDEAVKKHGDLQTLVNKWKETEE